MLDKDARGILRGTGTLVGKLYQLDSEVVTSGQISAIALSGDSDLWHASATRACQ